MTAYFFRTGGGYKPQDQYRISPERVYTYKVDFWRRAYGIGGDAMVEGLEAALESAQTILRRLWNDTDPIMHDAPEYSVLVASLQAIPGITPDMVSVLLAPSVTR